MYEHLGHGPIDYDPCRYGQSKILFRGPAADLQAPYHAVIGATETYGKFIELPFPALLSGQVGKDVVNLGCVNAGLDVFMRDPSVQDICSGADVCIVQALGAHNMSNRFYAVHPRRNDRFLRASAMLKSIYPEVDFSDFTFTRHLLGTLHRLSPERFSLVVGELQAAWVARMRSLSEQMGRSRILLVLNLPEDLEAGLGPEPLFITGALVDQLRGAFHEIIQISPSADALSLGTEGMVFRPMEEPAAQHLPGPAVHHEIAEALLPVVQRLQQ